MYIDTYQNLRKATPIFYRKDGTLTAYAMHCGYYLRNETNMFDTQVYFEHGIYHVKQFTYQNGRKNMWTWRTWRTYETYNEARSNYFELIRHAKNS